MPALYGGPVIYCRHCTVVPLPPYPAKGRAGRPRIFCPTCNAIRLIPARRRATRKAHRKAYAQRRQNRVCTKCRTPSGRFSLCNLCRRKKSQALLASREPTMRRPHGTLAAYTHDRCRCAACKQAHTAYVRDYRRRKSERPGG